jgi:hypothetical protein
MIPSVRLPDAWSAFNMTMTRIPGASWERTVMFCMPSLMEQFLGEFQEGLHILIIADQPDGHPDRPGCLAVDAQAEIVQAQALVMIWL